MPRPSLKEQRSQQILDAFIVCVARYGLEGATQERIAARAGVKRTLLRHYLGNRDDMTAALVGHLAARFDSMTDALEAALPRTGRVDALLHFMFDADPTQDAELALAWQALVAASDQLVGARKALLGNVSRLVRLVERELAGACPAGDKAQVGAVARGIVDIYFSVYALAALTPPRTWRRASARAARTLIDSLKETTDR